MPTAHTKAYRLACESPCHVGTIPSTHCIRTAKHCESTEPHGRCASAAARMSGDCHQTIPIRNNGASSHRVNFRLSCHHACTPIHALKTHTKRTEHTRYTQANKPHNPQYQASSSIMNARKDIHDAPSVHMCVYGSCSLHEQGTWLCMRTQIAVQCNETAPLSHEDSAQRLIFARQGCGMDKGVFTCICGLGGYIRVPE